MRMDGGFPETAVGGGAGPTRVQRDSVITVRYLQHKPRKKKSRDGLALRPTRNSGEKYVGFRSGALERGGGGGKGRPPTPSGLRRHLGDPFRRRLLPLFG